LIVLDRHGHVLSPETPPVRLAVQQQAHRPCRHPAPLPPLQKAGWGCSKEHLAELRAFKRRLSRYASCGEALMDDFLRPGLLIQD
jgi:hypothetical protein